MPLKQPKKTEQKKDSKSELELTVQSAINSPYSLIMPVADQTVIHIKNPVTKLMSKLKVDSQEYFELLDTMVGYGLMTKLHKDFQEVFQYAPAYTESWNRYKAKKETTIVN